MKDKIVIKSRDGTELAVSRFLPQVSNYTVVIIAPALGRRQKYYSRLASFLCKKGYVVFTFDYRGVGRSKKKATNRKNVSLYQWASIDLDTVILSAKNQFPGHELVGLAHGVSGEVVGLAPAIPFFSRLVLADAALSSWALANRQGRLRLLMAYFRKVACRWLPGVSSCLISNIPIGVFREWLSWSRYPNGLFHYYPNTNYQKLQAPILSIHFSEVPLSGPRAAAALLEQFANAQCSEWHLPASGQSFKTGRRQCLYKKRFKKVLWEQLAMWMQGEDTFQQSGKHLLEIGGNQ